MKEFVWFWQDRFEDMRNALKDFAEGFVFLLMWHWGKIVFGLFAMGVLVAVGAIVYADAVAEKIYLTKSDWECTEHRTRTTLMQTGKTTVPIISRECTVYVRR